MRTIMLGVILMAALNQEPLDTTVTYALAGQEKKELPVTYKAPKPGALFRMGYEGLPNPIQNLPFWLPPGLRKIGATIYDDGEGFKHDKGKLAYSIRSTGKWKNFDVLSTSYSYQGMQEFDNWTVAADYDKDTGFLLRAAVTTQIGDANPHVTSELTVTNSSDPALKKKVEVAKKLK